ncbi:MAG: hypothetical protein OXM02_07715 [Bacteroidota bacterium]|nr:hypothetical protein [Bacteroidota bacterium]MDE2834394.1 hypothetical protein [Bacteroidota bacterium]MDE2955930.1 hypothetical protein [Bacteroidota bacterium]
MKRLLAVLMLLVVPTLTFAQPDPNEPEGDDLTTPPSWKVRLDRPNPEATIGSAQGEVDIWFVNMTPGWHITTGPAAIFYHPESTASGNFRLEATIHLFDPGERREAYGVFMGGTDLEGENISYDYFLLRNTGQYLIKRRTGEETSLIQDWSDAESVANFGPDTEGSVENHLSVAVMAEEVVFSVNGVEVARAPRAEVHTEGMAGLRINHALNVHVSDFSVTPLE